MSDRDLSPQTIMGYPEDPEQHPAESSAENPHGLDSGPGLDVPAGGMTDGNEIPQHHHSANPVTATSRVSQCVPSGINETDRFELFLLGDGEKKVTEVADTRTPNSSIFTFAKEDHTLANLLRAHLLKDRHVMFAGYRVPHPLFANFELRVQTDGEITPKEALIACCRALVADLGTFSREFTKEYELRKMVGGEGSSGAK